MLFPFNTAAVQLSADVPIYLTQARAGEMNVEDESKQPKCVSPSRLHQFRIKSFPINSFSTLSWKIEISRREIRRKISFEGLRGCAKLTSSDFPN